MPPSAGQYGCCSRQDVRNFEGDRFCLSCGSALPRISSSLSSSLDSSSATAHQQSLVQQTGSDTCHYRHTRLASASEFRLLSLVPGKPSEELRGEILHADISAAPPYEALSYTWGSQRLTGSISIDGNHFEITENCRCALHSLRKRSTARMLWIDAICINQGDYQEKNHQLPLMSRIYSQAQRTLVYLGDENRLKITQLFDFLRRRDASGNKAPRPDEFTEEQRIHLQGELSWVLSLAWFTRVWVLQEVAVSRQSFVLLGAETLDWRLLSFGNIYSLGLNPVNKVKTFPRALQLSHNDRKPIKDLASLLAIARSCSSTDKHDNIYALLGIFKNKENIRVSVDYNKPIEQLYAEVAWQAIEASGHLELLSEAWTNINNDVTLVSEPLIILRKNIAEIALSGSLDPRSRPDNLLHGWNIDDLGRQCPSLTSKARCAAMLEAVGLLKAEIDRKSAATTLQRTAQSAIEQVQLFFESLTPFLPIEIPDICENPGLQGRQMAGLPSWVPNYSRHPNLHSLGTWNSRVTRLAESQPVAFVSYIQASQSPILRVSTLQLDYVKAADAQDSTKHIVARGARFVLRKQYSSDGRILRPYWVPVREPRSKTGEPTKGKLPGIQTHNADIFWETFEPELESSGHGAKMDAVQRFSLGRTIVLTKDSFAISPREVRPGDAICFVRGASVPFLLRPAGSEAGLPAYTLAGECYLHGTKGPKIAKDYMDLLGIFKYSFSSTNKEGLPWKEAYLV